MATLLAPQDSTNMSQAQWQEFFQGVFTNGVMNGQLNGYVTTVTSGLGISVASGKAVIQGFYARSDAAVALTCAAADPTNPRLDLVVLHADLTAHTLTVTLLTGTPAPSPSPPALTQTATVWEIAVCQVRVNATQTVLTAGSLTDVRGYFGIGGVGQDFLASINAAQFWTLQSGVANWFEFISWNASALEVPFGVGSGALAAALAKTIMGGSGQFQQVAGQATAGAFGVPVIVGLALNTTVTVTTLQTILALSVPVTGLYRISGSFAGNNGGVYKPLIQFTYSGGNAGVNITVSMTGPPANVYDGTLTASNGLDLALIPQVLYLLGGSTLTCKYQDNAGTPSDRITYLVERLA